MSSTICLGTSSVRRELGASMEGASHDMSRGAPAKGALRPGLPLTARNGGLPVAGIAQAVRAIRSTIVPMKALVLYASRHGHTQRVAEFVAAALRKRGWVPDLRDVASDPPAG